MKALLLLSVIVVGVVATSLHADAGPQPNRLVVHVVNDLNENGVRDEGEPGLAGWGIGRMSCNDIWIPGGTTGEDGTVTFTDSIGCVNLFVQFGWLQTSVTRTSVGVPQGRQDDIEFLVRHIGDDVQLFRGLPIVDGLPADMDASIDALVGGMSCGEGVISRTSGLPQYDLYVLGESERPGCARSGDTVSFTIDGVPAGSGTYTPEKQEEWPWSRLVAGPMPMYFEYSFSSPPGSTSTFEAVTPYVRDGVCGQGFSSWYPLAPSNNQYVFIRAAAAADGCGRPGAIVTLRAGDVVLEQLVWQAGQTYQQRLRRPGDADCDSDSDSEDAALVLQRSARLLEQLSCEDAVDVSGNGVADAVDAALILQHDAGFFEYFP